MRTSDQIIFVDVLVYPLVVRYRAERNKAAAVCYQLHKTCVCYVCMRIPYIILGTFGACGKKQEENNNNK